MALAAIDFGGTLTDVVIRRPGRPDALSASASLSYPRPKDVRRLLARTLGKGKTSEAEPITLLAVTGGRSAGLPLEIDGIAVEHVDESTATAGGALRTGAPTPAIVVSLGTGTGLVLARPPEDPVRLVGSGIGGGTLLGLGKLLLGTSEVEEIGRLARRGDVQRCDLTVGDILGSGVGPVPPEATASHFGKVGREGGKRGLRRADVAAALVNLVGQAALRLALESVLMHAARSIVLVGHVLDVPGFRESIERIPRLDRSFVYLADDPGFAVAQGALDVALARRGRA